MTNKLPPIYFYIPQGLWPDTMPKSADENWKGFGIGIYAWTLQTYLRLKADGFPCELVAELPREGIVLIHRNCLRAHNDQLKPGPKLLLICIKAEQRPYPYAQLHVVQNPLETMHLRNSYYLPHWTQPGLIQRHPARCDRFETIAFFGHENNIALEFYHPSWQQQLQALGLSWQPVINRNHWHDYSNLDNRWHDYSQIDAIVAVRSFEGHTGCLHGNYVSKPATKLYNAWLAGVPAILGCEAAYQAERYSPLDYVEVATPSALISALKRLKEEPNLRSAMVNNGRIRAKAITPSSTTKKWRYFLETIALPAYDRWCNQSHWSQQITLGQGYIGFQGNRVKDKLTKVLLASNNSR